MERLVPQPKTPANPSASIPASTVVLMRSAAQAFEVFLVSRHHQIDSFSGAAVFPGGKVDPGDHELRVAAPLAGPPERAFWVAAIREAFEECGILLARHNGKLVTAAQLCDFAAERKALHEGTINMGDFCERHSLQLAFDLLRPFARWITPKPRPKRFDTWFFTAAAPADQVASHDGIENLSSRWIRPDDAIQAAQQGQLSLVFPTWMNLRRLAEHSSLESVQHRPAFSEIVTVQPRVEAHPDGHIMNIPADAGYHGDRWFVSADGTRLEALPLPGGEQATTPDHPDR